ncbi:DUF4446 family protein [Nocardioides dilutus]
MEILTVLSLVVAVLALAVAAAAWRRLPSYAGDPDALPEDVVGLRQEVAALRTEAAGAFRHLGIVRYDAFSGAGPQAGGRLSWSVALLDDSGSGVVLTAIHGRSEARSYAKSISDWTCDQPLSPEEEQAVASARP